MADLENPVTELVADTPHFVEWLTTRPLPLGVLETALAEMGLGHSVLDTDRSFERATPDAPAFVRFVTVPERNLRPRDIGALTWRASHAVQIPLFAGLQLTFPVRPVKRGAIYDLRFFVRTKSAPTRGDVEKLLENIGFSSLALTLMKRDVRLPGHPLTSHDQWYVRALWSKGDSAIVPTSDPIAVEEMALVAAPKPEDTSTNSTVSGHVTSGAVDSTGEP